MSASASCSSPLVIYHANCSDGFCAAWIAHSILGEAAEYYPAHYGQEPPDVKDREVYILDFSYKLPVMQQIYQDCRRLVVLDHHKTAEADLKGFGGDKAHVVFDMEHSGGRLAWDHFRPGYKRPWLVDYTEDRDLWRWQLAGSREISAALDSYPRTFAQWDNLYFQYPYASELQPLITQGAAILRYQQKLVDDHCRNAQLMWLGGHEILAVNATCLFSEIAGKLAEQDGGRAFGAAWFIRSDGQRQWSLRSRGEQAGGVDVSEIARKFGGGGHRNAAGFQEPAGTSNPVRKT